MRRLTLSVLLTAAALVACGPAGQPSNPPLAPTSAAAPQTTPPAAQPTPRWQPGQQQHGVAIYWPDNHDDSLQVVQAKAERVLDYVQGLGANAVSLSFPYYTTGRTGTAITSGKETPSPQRVATVVRAAQARGLRISLRPTMDEANLHPLWRGAIAPADHAQWFANLQAWLDPYLELAQGLHVDEFVIGTEFDTMETDPGWAGLMAHARTRYTGQFGYSQDWSSFQRPVTVAVDTYGLDPYFPVNLPDSSSPEQIEAAWAAWFTALPRAVNLRELVLDEVGIPAQAGAYRAPNAWSDPHASPNETVQATWFTAVCQFAHDHQLAGLYFWKLDFHQNPADPTYSDRGSFVGRRAQDAIRRCYTGG